jgi:hypothetical protein
MELNGQLHNPASLPREKEPTIRDWVGSRAGLDTGEEKKSLASAENRTSILLSLSPWRSRCTD